MRYQALTLDHIYTILSDMEKPIALFDFVSGEMGYEALCAQAVCGRFYDNFASKMPVVALCWKGGSLLYSNVSHHQIEIDDIAISISGNLQHRGENRWAHLVLNWHRNCIEEIPDIIEYIPAMYWVGGHVDERRLLGYLSPDYFEARQYSITRRSLIQYTKKRLAETQFIFNSATPRIIEVPYIALFDRNEPRIGKSQGRNTLLWHIELMQNVAEILGIQLVIISGLHPREPIGDIIYVEMQHRNMDLLCNVIRNSLLFIAPACGIAEVAVIFGCDLLVTQRLGVGHDDLINMIIQRGFDYLGILDKQDYGHIIEYVKSKCLAL